MSARALAPFLVFVLVVAAGCTGRDSDAASPPGAASPSAGATPSPTPLGSDHFEAGRALAHIQELAGTIGPRVAGSSGEDRAIRYIAAQFRDAGYTVEIQPFSFDGDPFRPAEVTTAAGTHAASTMSGSLPGEVQAVAVFVGTADASGMSGKDLAGKVAVADRGGPTFREKYDAVHDAGAAALIVVNNQPGVFTGTINTRGEFPVVSMTQPDGASVREAAIAGQPVTVTSRGGVEGRSTNLLARPTADAVCTVLVGGHHDSVPGAPGAHDNASGTASVVELARALAVPAPRPGVCFATFGAEESGLHGSEAMVDAMKEKGALPRYYINLDMTGEGSLVSVMGTAEFQRQAVALAETLKIPARADELPAFLGSDHQSFQRAGVPSVMLTTDDDGEFHTPLDTPDRMQPDELQRIGTLAQALILQLVAQVARG